MSTGRLIKSYKPQPYRKHFACDHIQDNILPAALALHELIIVADYLVVCKQYNYLFKDTPNPLFFVSAKHCGLGRSSEPHIGVFCPSSCHFGLWTVSTSAGSRGHCCPMTTMCLIGLNAMLTMSKAVRKFLICPPAQACLLPGLTVAEFKPNPLRSSRGRTINLWIIFLSATPSAN